jgi:probable phosphoglycerate mutase
VIVLVRHGESAWNAEARLQGQADAPLSELGREQARGLVVALRGLDIAQVVTSDLSRARDTAGLAGHPDALPDARWRERGLGVWEGHLESDLEPGVLQEFRRTDVPPEGGELWPDFQARVGGALDELAERGGSWLVFTHGGCVRAAVAHLTGADHRTVAGPANASLTVLQTGRRRRMVAFNWTPAEDGALRIPVPSDPGGVSVRTPRRAGGASGAYEGHASS